MGVGKSCRTMLIISGVLLSLSFWCVWRVNFSPNNLIPCESIDGHM
jgi:hypothetical protein